MTYNSASFHNRSYDPMDRAIFTCKCSDSDFEVPCDGISVEGESKTHFIRGTTDRVEYIPRSDRDTRPVSDGVLDGTNQTVEVAKTGLQTIQPFMGFGPYQGIREHILAPHRLSTGEDAIFTLKRGPPLSSSEKDHALSSCPKNTGTEDRVTFLRLSTDCWVTCDGERVTAWSWGWNVHGDMEHQHYSRHLTGRIPIDEQELRSRVEEAISAAPGAQGLEPYLGEYNVLLGADAEKKELYLLQRSSSAGMVEQAGGCSTVRDSSDIESGVVYCRFSLPPGIGGGSPKFNFESIVRSLRDHQNSLADLSALSDKEKGDDDSDNSEPGCLSTLMGLLPAWMATGKSVKL
jgi:hypothetical protein